MNNTISSHLDIMPTIIDLLKLPNTFSTVGSSLLSKKDDNNAVAYIRAGNLTGIINNEGYILHSLKKETPIPQPTLKLLSNRFSSPSSI